MKRVLNSGSIKLPYIQGSERDIFNKAKEIWYADQANKLCNGAISNDELMQIICNSGWVLPLQSVQFTFEIRAPLLVFIEGFQRSKLGTLTLLDGQDHQIGYLPQQYFNITSNLMNSKACNDYNTKLNNFYNWAFNFYNKLIEQGLDKSQAALVLPQGIFKTFLFEVNAKDLISFIELNIGKSPELNGYASTLVLYLDDHLPNVTSYLKRNQWKDLG